MRRLYTPFILPIRAGMAGFRASSIDTTCIAGTEISHRGEVKRLLLRLFDVLYSNAAGNTLEAHGR